MKAVEFNKKLVLNKNYPKPQIKKNEALIKVSMAGICNTDIEIIKGYMGFSGVLGHEFVGIVEECNDKSLVGKRVAGEINCGCKKCEYCQNDLERHCLNRSVLGIFNKDGCMAEYIVLPADNLLVIPNNLTDEEATFIEPVAAAFEILEQVFIRHTDKILVLGDGKLGLLIALVLNQSKGDLTLIGKHRDKLEIAKKQGVKTILLENLEEKRNFDIVIDATGSINGFELAQKLVKPRGTIVLKSTVAGGKELNLAPLVVDEITLVGSRCGRFKPAIEALEKKLIDVKPLISKIYSIDESLEAFETAKRKDILKVLLKF